MTRQPIASRSGGIGRRREMSSAPATNESHPFREFGTQAVWRTSRRVDVVIIAVRLAVLEWKARRGEGILSVMTWERVMALGHWRRKNSSIPDIECWKDYQTHIEKNAHGTSTFGKWNFNLMKQTIMATGWPFGSNWVEYFYKSASFHNWPSWSALSATPVYSCAAAALTIIWIADASSASNRGLMMVSLL